MDYCRLYIFKNASVKDALKQIDSETKKILFLVEENKLLGTITDGDIRRYLLKGGSIEATIKEAANFNPNYVSDSSLARDNMIKKKVTAMPILNEDKEILDIVFIDDNKVKITNPLNLDVVIMAGGKGTRLYPYTKILPKPLIPIGEYPIAEHIMNEFLKYECQPFHYIVNHKKQMIKAYFGESNYQDKIFFYDEDEPLGTGGGLSLLKGKLTKTFFLTNCDILLKANYSDIVKFHKEEKNKITVVCAYKHLVVPYGVIDMGMNGEILKMEEKPEYSFLTNTGFYVVEPDVLEEIKEHVAVGFPEIIKKQMKDGKKVGVYPVSEKSWLDMGQLEEMEEMRKALEKTNK